MSWNVSSSYFVCAYIWVVTISYLKCIKMRRSAGELTAGGSVAFRPFRTMPIAEPETALASRIIPVLVVGGHLAKNYSSSGSLEALYDFSITCNNLQRLARRLNDLRNPVSLRFSILTCHPEEAESLAKRETPDEWISALCPHSRAASELHRSFGANRAPQNDNVKDGNVQSRRFRIFPPSAACR